MDPRKWAILFQTFIEDLAHKTLDEIRDGCRRYRTNPENRFFPSPGQLLEACRNPFDSPPHHRHYSEPALIGNNTIPPTRAQQVIEATRKRLGLPVQGPIFVEREPELHPTLRLSPEEIERREAECAPQRRALIERARAQDEALSR